jgi:hypothetical protein
MITAKTQPFCHWCGKPLRKHAVRRHPPGQLGFNDSTLRTLADCQRRENQKVISVQYRWDYDDGDKIPSTKRIHSYAVWDGETYQAVLEFFCTNDCAMSLGHAAAKHHNIVGKAFNEATRKAKP